MSIKISLPSDADAKKYPREYALYTQIPGSKTGSVTAEVSTAIAMHEPSPSQGPSYWFAGCGLRSNASGLYENTRGARGLDMDCLLMIEELQACMQDLAQAVKKFGSGTPPSKGKFFAIRLYRTSS